MNQYVYLWELDTVNTSDQELKAADKRIYRLLVLEGDRLVLSYNQLCDSLLIEQWIQNPDLQALMLRCIQNDRVVISPFAGFHSGVEYIEQRALLYSIHNFNQGHEDKQFIFSAFPSLRPLSYYQRHVIYCNLLETIQTANLQHLEELESLQLSPDPVPMLQDYVQFLLQVNLLIDHQLSAQSTEFTLADCMKDCLTIPAIGDNVREYLSPFVQSQADKRSPILHAIKYSDLSEEDRKEGEQIVNFCYNWRMERNICASGTELKNPVQEDNLGPSYAAFTQFYRDTIRCRSRTIGNEQHD